MHASQLTSSSLWLEYPRPEFPALDHDLRCDVAIIGGGMTGLTAAYLLSRAGRKVALFEKYDLCNADTGHTTAHLISVTDQRLRDLVSDFGEEAAKLTWHGGQLAIDFIEELSHELMLDCEFQRVPGWLHEAFHAKHDESDQLREEAKLASQLGFISQFVEHSPMHGRPGVRYDDQALFNPVRYLSGVAEAIVKAGGQIFTHSEMTHVESNPLHLAVNGHGVRCDKLIIATHVPLMGETGLMTATAFQTKLYGYSTYVVAGSALTSPIPPGSYNDTDSPYQYLRVQQQEDGRYEAILGGKDHKTGQADDAESRYDALGELLEELIPGVSIDHRWSGQVIETNDGLPYIGPVTDQQFVATGYAGNGMTFGTLSGMMACDWVLGRENPWQELFSLSRTNLRAGLWDYLKENAGYPYHLLRGYLRTMHGNALSSLEPNEGRVLKLHGQRRAVYRHPDGHLSNCSAICTHLGCVVEWNHAEKTWDCPCHGSRFSTDGDVLAGPAEEALKKE